ncbi:integrase [Streptacidiphilus sp. EB129]|uniref:integrase n=1 Tax=Streptacidiphilus sp. EB129 TaxID=3156262 RepID=UPI003518F2C4
MTVRAAGWARRLPHVPLWWDEFAAYLTTYRNPAYAGQLITHTGRLLQHTAIQDPRALLAHCQAHHPQLSPVLNSFFIARDHLPTPSDPQDERATARRTRRLDAIPGPLRPAVEAFAEDLLARRRQCDQLGLQPVKLKTIEVRLDTIRDLALHLDAPGRTTWAGVHAADLERFLARNPARRAAWLAGLRQFFAHAHRTGTVLHDPAAALNAAQHRGFRGPTLAPDEQRALYQRWTTNPDIHPHEAFIGLAALLHAATTTEVRFLTDCAIDTARHGVQFPGRPVATPLDPATWTALERCQWHRTQLGSANPHLLVTRRTKTTRNPAGAAHIRDTLAPTGLLPRILRSTRLITLADQLDIELLSVSLGMSYSGVTPYLQPPVHVSP